MSAHRLETGVGIETVVHTENLGIDFVTAGRLIRTRHKERLRTIKTRMNRFVRIGRKAGTHCFKTGAIPAVRHELGVCGVTVATMKSLNKMGCRVIGRMKGARSNYARLALATFNPGHFVFLDPLRCWARAI